jgi:aerobic-type carbon monoxide dehydrogenase small subunit (CoxS/CutS family)
MIRLAVNESTHEWPDSAGELPLLYALRNDLGLRGPRFGCGQTMADPARGIDGQPKRSCWWPRLHTLEQDGGLGTTAPS